MSIPLALIGAGGHAKVCIDVLRRQGLYTPVACVDAAARGNTVMGVSVIGGDEYLESLRREGISHAFCAIGNNIARERLCTLLFNLGYCQPNIVDPGSIFSSSSKFGEGTLIMPGSIVNAEAVVQSFCILNTGSVVEHDCFIGRCSHVAPRATLAGSVEIGKRVLVGAGAVIKPGIKIGDDVVIGSGSAVIRDVPNDKVVFGVPAHKI